MLSRLDIRSRQVVRNFLFRLSLNAWMVVLVAGLGKWPYQRALGAFHLTCAASAMVAMTVALFRGEKPSDISLNLWDESLAFSALGLLALFVWRELGGFGL